MGGAEKSINSVAKLQVFSNEVRLILLLHKNCFVISLNFVDKLKRNENSPNLLKISFSLSSSMSSPKFLMYTLVNSFALAPSSASRSLRDLKRPTKLKESSEFDIF